MKYLSALLVFVGLNACVHAQIGGIINEYNVVEGYDPCENALLAKYTANFQPGDTVLLIQMKGATANNSNTSAYGTVLDYGNAGNYEFNYITRIEGNRYFLKNLLTRTYDFKPGYTQLVRVPYYGSVTVTAPLTALPWDGERGGILVFNVKETLTLEASINVSAAGFRGGKGQNTGLNRTVCQTNGYSYPLNSQVAAEKGESIVHFEAVGMNNRGKGALAAGGGGGLDHNSGGGGGGNGTPGGMGGYQLYECSNAHFDNRGIGGRALPYNLTVNKIFPGSGGGAGHCNNSYFNPAANTDFSGGNGGGIVLIHADRFVGNGHTISARGATAYELNTTADEAHDGIGGGGAGGTVLLRVNQFADAADIDVTGGKGGDMFANLAGGRIGPGGGGAGGVVWFSQAAQPANVSIDNAGGRGGVIVLNNNDPFGTTPGSAGLTLFGLTMPPIGQPFKKNIDSVRIDMQAPGCNQFVFDARGYTNMSPITTWQWTFGDGETAASPNVTHHYRNTGNYTVKLVGTDAKGCRDSADIPVTVLPDFDFNYTQDVCNPLQVQFTRTGPATGQAWWSLGDGMIITNNNTPGHTFGSFGDYIVKLHVPNACPDTVIKTIPVTVIKEDVVLTPDTTICDGVSKTLRARSALSYCWSPVTHLDNPSIQNPVTSTTEKITYYLTAAVAGNNLVTNGDFSAGNTGFTSEYSFAISNLTEAQYFVGVNPRAWNPQLSACGDHTTGNGPMMLINGAPMADVNVWSQTIQVTPHTNYAFSTWIQALYPPNPAQLQFSINGNTIGTLITASLPTCTWTQFYATWNSGNSTTAVISIVNKNTQVQGNDFALDDISFAPVTIMQDSVTIDVDKPVVVANNDTTVCSGAVVRLEASGAQSYTWSPATGLSDAGIPNPVATPASSTEYIVTGTTVHGCQADDTVAVNTFPLPVIRITDDTVICHGNMVPLQASGGVTYTWSPQATLSDHTLANPVAAPDTSTTYVVEITDTYACRFLDSVKVDIYPIPGFTVSPDAAICQGADILLHAAGGDYYSWTPAVSLNDPNAASPMATPEITTRYTVHISESTCGYETLLSTEVTVNPNPVVTARKSNDIDCSAPTALLTATGADLYAWTPATGLDFPDRYNPTAAIDSTTMFLVTGTNGYGCSSADSVQVVVSKTNMPIYPVPNAFTPNGDNRNDCFGIRRWGAVKLIEFSVYNRWGQRVFTTNNPAQCWDGTFNGKPQDSGAFAYLIRAHTFCGEVKRTGIIMLIR